MQQVLVVYYSKTGNTKKLAQYIAAGVADIDGVTCLLKPVSEVTREMFLQSDAIIAGSPVYFGGMAGEMKRLFDDYVDIRNKMEDKIGAAFATAGDASGGKETTILSIIEAMLIYGMIVVGDPLSATGHYGVSCVGAPDRKTAENARKLGKRVASLVRKAKS
jgi:NAD(P)H dehydrogenase (quinone)